MNFKRKILIQIYAIWLGRWFFQPLVRRVLALFLAFYFASWWISFRQIINNALTVQGFENQWNFWSGAVLGTDWLTQVFLGLILFLGGGIVLHWFKRSRSRSIP